ncbi:ABC transporter substrate-binding protein, partial [Streptomyces ardesiacus]
MRTSSRARKRLSLPFALVASAALLLTACGSGDPATDVAGAAAGSDAVPTTDVVSGVRRNADAVRLLPPGTGELTLAVSVGGTPKEATDLDVRNTTTGQVVEDALEYASEHADAIRTEHHS